MQGESKLSADIRDAVHDRWSACLQKNAGNKFMARGIPDLTGCVEGRAVALEVKMPARRSNLSEWQVDWLDRYRSAGAICGVVCSVEEALSLIEGGL